MKPTLQIISNLTLLELQVYLQIKYKRLLCKLGKHQMGKWNYPTRFSRPHYFGKISWRYCERECGFNQTEQEFYE